MIQLKIGDTFIDLYDEDLPKLTLSIEDIQTTDTTTTFSRQFRVPNTTTNFEIFKTLYSVNGRDFDITTQQEATILVDGDIFQQGEIRLLNIYTNRIDDIIDYEIAFLGGARNFNSSLGTSLMCELSFPEFQHTANDTNIALSWQAYPQTPSGQTSGLLNGSIIYPLIDFGNQYDEDGNAIDTKIQNGGVEDSFVDGFSTDLTAGRFRPCIKVIDVWDKIFDNSGFTYASTFLSSNLFRHLYLGAWGDEALARMRTFATAKSSLPQIWDDQVEFIIDYNSTNNNGTGWDLTDNKYTIPRNGGYDISANAKIRSAWTSPDYDGSHDITIRLKKISGGITTTLADVTITMSGNGVNSETEDFINISINNASLLLGDKIFVTIQVTNATDWEASQFVPTNNRCAVAFDVSDDPGAGLSCDVQQIDFIRDILTKFRLVMAPDKFIPNKFIIEPWQEYIGTGDLFDWTEKLDASKDLVIKPIFFTQKNQIEYLDAKGDDFLNVINQEDLGEVYGRLLFNANNELLKGKRTIQTNFVPIPTTQIPLATETDDGADNMIIPQIIRKESVQLEDGTNIIQNLPVKPGFRLFWYDGLKNSGTSPARDVTWYFENTSYTKFPMISQFNEWGDYEDSWQGIDTQTRDLNWQRETGYIKFDLQNVFLGNSAYDEYWGDYINTLYDKWSRRVTAYFILSSTDLIDFSFDDVIFVKDAYYYVEKIYDVVVGEKTSVKVDLIKLNNYLPNPDNFIPIGLLWENLLQDWEDVSDNWEDV